MHASLRQTVPATDSLNLPQTVYFSRIQIPLRNWQRHRASNGSLSWGFHLEDIHVPVGLWHGEADNLAPPMLAHYIAQRVSGCEATFYAGEGHTDPLTKHIDEIVMKVVSASRLI